jgi:hypothetical protein
MPTDRIRCEVQARRRHFFNRRISIVNYVAPDTRPEEMLVDDSAQVIDPSIDESATAVLEKISGAELIAARQRQARTAFIADIVEQLVIDNKRVRDTETTALNMQLTTWREAGSANQALMSGTGDALRTWRQP